MEQTLHQHDDENTNPARRLWDAHMERHPNIHGALAIVGYVLDFIFNFKFVVAIGHWVIMTSGRVAETVLLFATLWITAVNVEPTFMQAHIPGGVEQVKNLSSLSIMAFALLPEVIVFSAIITTYDHWMRFFRNRTWMNPEWVWSILYTAPTISFLTMTIITICSFVSNSGHLDIQTNGPMLVTRTLSAWFFVLIELIYAVLSKRHATSQQHTNIALTTLQEQIAAQGQEIERIQSEQAQDLQAAISHIEQTTKQHIQATLVQLDLQHAGRINSAMQEMAAQIDTQYSERIRTAVTQLDGQHTQQLQRTIQDVIEQLDTRQAERIASTVESATQTMTRVVIEQVTTATAAQKTIAGGTSTKQLALQAPRPDRRRFFEVAADNAGLSEETVATSNADGTATMSKEDAKTLVYELWLKDKALMPGQLDVVKANIVTRQSVYNWIKVWEKTGANIATEQVEITEQQDESEVAR